ncbi:MAG TPA: hypothetical protein VF622_11385 [Segetibacter sp.]|jgi:hypothetical protein
MLEFFQKIIDVLNKYNIPYMLSGSVAMSLYVVPRATRDFDFIVSLNLQHVDLFVDDFKNGFYCDKDSITDAIKHHGMFNIIDHASGFKADFVILKSIPFRQHEFGRRVPMDFFGKEIYVVTAEDLLISKLIWIQDIQSAIQMEDISNLLVIETLDVDYVKDWVSRLELNTFNLLK